MTEYVQQGSQSGSSTGTAVSSYVSQNREEVFDTWKKPPSDTEKQKAESMKSAIRRALDASPSLSNKNIRVAVHGSYGTNTNVRNNSDIDIQVVFTDYYHNDYTGVDGLTPQDVGLSPTSYSLDQARADVLAALRSHFGTERVTDKNKAINVEETGSQLQADVIACFVHRRFHGTRRKPWYHEGVRFSPKAGGHITNWPQQNINNGNQKANDTNRRFKKVVRIFKRLNIHMAEAGIGIAKKMSSYQLECLVWNVPDNHFGHDKIDGDVRESIAYLFHAMDREESHEWGEINDLVYLLRGNSPSRQAVKEWTKAAWNHCGYGEK